MKGELECRHGKWVAWCAALGGYISDTGFTKKFKKALKFEGPGEAICAARECGFAIIAW